MNLKKKSSGKQKKVSTTRPYVIVAYLCTFLFLCLIVYMIYFQVFKSEALLNSPYNTGDEAASDKIIRGSILAQDGTVLAQTTVAEDGTETRTYPLGSLFAQAVGYEAYGGSGLEAVEGKYLLQTHSDIGTQITNDLNDKKKQGDNVVTTFNTSLQQTAADAMGSNRGAVIVMDADTGDVLVDYSSPTYDPNTVVTDWDTLTADTNGILMNRALQGLYPPGSTFKMVTALAYLRQYGNFDNFSFNCDGTYTYGDFTIHCAGYEAHGPENFADAMANSCNSAFAYMAVNMIDKTIFRQTADSLGFNDQKLTLQLPSETSTFSLDANTAGELTMQTAIGQGDTQATPVQMCMIADAIANGGNMMTPVFVSGIQNSSGVSVKENAPVSYGQVMSADEASKLTEIMKQVVQRGTATDLSDLPYDIAGKTGTAEYGDVNEGKAHSWFVGFSNTGNNDIVVCAVVEDGGNGIAPATQVARPIFQTYFGG